MKLGKPSTRYSLMTALYTTIGLLFYWWSIIRDSHLYLFSTEGDGIRNYFVTLYYALYDKNQTFTGLNYPFPENISFSNAQPFFSIIFQKLLNENFEYAGNVVSIMNLLMLFSIPLGAVFIYRIFSLWRMPNVYSTIIAAAIALLSPQVMKMNENIAFSYVCFFPMIWYYSARWLQDQKVISLILYLFTLTIFGFIHTYYLGLGFIFTFITLSFYSIYKIKHGRLLIRGLLLFIFSVIPFVLYFLLLNTESNIILKEKPSDYLTFLNQKVSLLDIAIPLEGVVKNVFNVFWPIQEYETHGYAYLGMAAIISTLLGIWVLKDRVLEEKFFPHGMGVFMASATVCLILAFQIPFNVIPLENIPMTVFRFVNLNAFAWAFYFVFTAISAWLLFILSEYLRKKSYSVTAMSILILVGSLWMAEALSYQKAQASRIRAKGKLVNEFLSFENNYHEQLVQIGVNPSLYQGMIAFPYFNKNAEISIERDERTFFYAAKAALNLHLPLVQNYKNNSNLTQTVNSVQLLSHPLIKKQIVKDFHDDQSILLMTIGNTFQKDEQRLIKKSRLLTERNGVAFYDLPLSAFTENTHYKNSSSFKNIYHSDDKSQSIYWQDFAWKKTLKKGNLISDFYIHNTNLDTLELSIWIEIPTFNYEPVVFNLDLSDENKNLIQRYFLDYKNSTDLMDNKIRIHTKIYTGIKDNYFKLSSNINSNSHIGTILVKPLQTSIATVNENDEVFLDNYLVEKQ